MTCMTRAAAMPFVMLLALAGCEAQKSSNPLSPSVAGPIGGVVITPPKLLEPGQGIKFKESQQPIRLLIENASSTGVRPLTYLFEVASDEAFASKVFARGGVPAGDGGRTSVQVDRLDLGRAYWWRARAEDGANSSQYATAQFEVLARPLLNAPGLVSPINNARVSEKRPQLTISNSDRNSAVADVRYDFQVATDQAFTQLVSAAQIAETGGAHTAFKVDADLPGDRQHFWRARATDAETTSAWSGTQTFRSAVAVVTPPTPPTPPPGGGTCTSGNPTTIVECERARYGFMSRSQMASLMRAIARSLNRNGIAGAPFGILRKNFGSQCDGYSCDIICAGQGSGQRQWDVLGDIEGAQSPGWSGPKTVPDIRVDVCEIQ